MYDNKEIDSEIIIFTTNENHRFPSGSWMEHLKNAPKFRKFMRMEIRWKSCSSPQPGSSRALRVRVTFSAAVPEDALNPIDVTIAF